MVKNPPAAAGDVRDLGLIPGSGSLATLSSSLAWRIPMDRGAWWATVCGVTKSWTRLKTLSTNNSIRDVEDE